MKMNVLHHLLISVSLFIATTQVCCEQLNHGNQASPTDVLVTFLRDLTENHKITESDLRRFQKHLAKGELTNPILESDARKSSDLYYPWQIFNENLECSTIAAFDRSVLQQQVAKLICLIRIILSNTMKYGERFISKIRRIFMMWGYICSA